MSPQPSLAVALADVERRRLLPDPRFRRILRIQAGLSQEDIARAVGVTRSTVARWEGGSRSPSGAALVGYLDVLDMLMEAAH